MGNKKKVGGGWWVVDGEWWMVKEKKIQERNREGSRALPYLRAGEDARTTRTEDEREFETYLLVERVFPNKTLKR